MSEWIDWNGFGFDFCRVKLCILAVFSAFALSDVSVSASPIVLQCQPKQISHTPDNDVNPDIHGSLIVWRHVRKSDRKTQIYMYDTRRGRHPRPIDIKLNNGKLAQIDYERSSQPRVFGERIVFSVESSWVSGGAGGKSPKFSKGWGVYLYDIRSKRLHRFLKESKKYWIYYWEGNQQTPILSDGRLVYILNGDVVLRDPIPHKITKTKSARNPNIDHNIVVWQDRRNGNWDIYMYDTNRKMQQIVTTSVADQVYPAVYHDKIVWLEKRGGVYLHDLSSKKTRLISRNQSKQMFPAIHKHWIAWSDHRRGNWDIYVYSVRTGRTYLLTDNPADQLYPSIYNDTIVWEDNRNGNWDIYMCRLKETRKH